MYHNRNVCENPHSKSQMSDSSIVIYLFLYCGGGGETVAMVAIAAVGAVACHLHHHPAGYVCS